MKKLCIVIISIALTSCAYIPKKAYDGSSRGKYDVAFISGDFSNLFNSSVYSNNISSSQKIENGMLSDKRIYGSESFGFAKEVSFLPGRYLVETWCQNGSSYAYPSIDLDVKAGFTYTIRCEPVADSAGMLKAVLKSVEKTK
jgi:hypothetical protein